MGMLRSYSFGTFMGVDEIPENVLGLFEDALIEGRKISRTSEIIYAGLTGGIDLNSHFNLEAYERAIEKNENLSAYAKKKKEMYIDFDCSSDDYDVVFKQGGIQADKINIKKVQDEYEELMDADELVRAVANVKRLNNDFVIVEEVDIIEALRLALKGIPQAIKELKRICNFYPRISEDIKVILGSGKEVDEVFA